MSSLRSAHSGMWHGTRPRASHTRAALLTGEESAASPLLPSCLRSTTAEHVLQMQSCKRKTSPANDTQTPKQSEELYSKEGTSHPLNLNVPWELLPW